MCSILENPTGLVEGLVSGIKNQRINTERRAAAAMLGNTTVRPKLTTMTPNSVVLNEAPIPDAIPTRPYAKLKRSLPFVTSAHHADDCLANPVQQLKDKAPQVQDIGHDLRPE